MQLGFIGTGKITTSIIEGLLKSKVKVRQFNISKRNIKNSNLLKKLSKKVKVYDDNQNIINQSSIIFISLVPKVAVKEIPKLKFKKTSTVVSLVSTLNLKALKKLCGPVKNIVKACPLPMARFGLSPTIVFPKNKQICALFDGIGVSIVAQNENQNNHLWVMGSLMASYVEIIRSFQDYLTQNKIKNSQSEKYLNLFLTGMLFELHHGKFDLKKLSKELQTKGGINEELLKRLTQDKVFVNLKKNLNKIFQRIKKANDK